MQEQPRRLRRDVLQRYRLHQSRAGDQHVRPGESGLDGHLGTDAEALVHVAVGLRALRDDSRRERVLLLAVPADLLLQVREQRGDLLRRVLALLGDLDLLVGVAERLAHALQAVEFLEVSQGRVGKPVHHPAVAYVGKAPRDGARDGLLGDAPLGEHHVAHLEPARDEGRSARAEDGEERQALQDFELGAGAPAQSVLAAASDATEEPEEHVAPVEFGREGGQRRGRPQRTAMAGAGRVVDLDRGVAVVARLVGARLGALVVFAERQVARHHLDADLTVRAERNATVVMCVHVWTPKWLKCRSSHQRGGLRNRRRRSAACRSRTPWRRLCPRSELFQAGPGR